MANKMTQLQQLRALAVRVQSSISAVAQAASDAVTAVDKKVDGKAPSSHTHDASNITSGSLSVARGGTGANDVSAALNNLTRISGGQRTVDWNTLASGIYTVDFNANSVDQRNTYHQPVGAYPYGTLYVTNNGNIGQIYIAHAMGELWFRDRWGSGNDFSPWTYTSVYGHTHDDRYYTESEIDTKLAAKAAASHTHTKSQISDFPTSLPASDVPSWAKASSKPSYAWSEIQNKPSSFTPASHTHDDRYYTESEINTKLSGKSDTSHTHSAATTSAAGMMSAADKAKLDGIAAGANNYTLTSSKVISALPTRQNWTASLPGPTTTP